MRSCLLLLTLTLVVPACASLEERLIVGLLDHYVAAQEALASDDYDEAKVALEALAGGSEGDLESLAARAAECADIDSMREAFELVSDQMEKIDLPESFMVVFCPHGSDGEEASWVQKGEEIRNPYHGTALLECGTLKDEAENVDSGEAR